jgi:hypothetical protein
MNCKGWDCNVPACKMCQLEMELVQAIKKRSELEYMSTGWKIQTGIIIAYKHITNKLTE